MTTPTPDHAVELPFVDGDARFHGRLTVDNDDRVSFIPVVAPGEYKVRELPGGVWALVPVPVDPDARPYRVVDRFGRGWLTCHEPATTYPHIEGDWPLARVVAERGPVRPVVAASRASTDLMGVALARAGCRAVASFLVALRRVAEECVALHGHDDLLIAGRPGSWESALLRRLAYDAAPRVADATTDMAAVGTVRNILHRWVFGEDAYVEVAETVAGVFGQVVDGRGGWDQVTQRWLRRWSYNDSIRTLLASRSQLDHDDHD